MKRPRLVLVLLWAVVFVPGFFTRDLYMPDEIRYGEVGREMTTISGAWLVPRLNGEVYSEKPPLFFWLVAGTGLATGGDFTLGPRFWSALGALGTLLLVFRLGADLASRRAGFLAALVCMTASYFLVHANRGTLDALVTFFVVLSLHAWLRVLAGPGARRWLVVFWVSAALGTLVKGPLALLVPGLVAVVHRSSLDGWRRGLRPSGAFAGGLVLYLVLVGAWLVPALVAGGPDYAEAILFKQNVGRFGDSWRAAKPLWFHATTFPAAFLPWTLLLPWAGLEMWRERRTAGSPARFLLSWFLTTFVFFSIASAKLPRYLLPAYPAAALAIGIVLDRAAGRPAPGVLARRHLVALAGLFIAMGVGLTGIGIFHPLVDGLLYKPQVRQTVGLFATDLRSVVVAGGVPVLIGGALALVLARRERVLGAALVPAGLVVLLAVIFNCVVAPRIDPGLSGRPAVTAFAAEIRPGDAVFAHIGGAANFYTATDHYALPGHDRLRELVAEGRPWVLVVGERWWEKRSRSGGDIPGRIVFRQPMLRGSDLIVIVFRPEDDDP